MEQDIKEKLELLEEKIEETRKAAVAVKNMFLWTLIISVVMFVLPLIGLIFVIPQIFSTYQEIGGMIP